MQGKDVSEQETKGESSVGIDVCEAWLDVHVLPAEQAFRVPNSYQGHRTLKRRLERYDLGLIVIEATGKWHRQLHRTLHAGGYEVRVVNPLRARLFAESMGLFGKTDRLDARMLAVFAAKLGNAARPPAPELVEALQELVQARTSAVEEQTALANQRKNAETVFLRRQLGRRLKRIAADIKAIETEVLNRLKADEVLMRRYAILRSIPSFGPVVAMTLLARLPELGGCNDKQIATLAGLAPWPDDSGPREGPRHIRGGRRPVCNILYLAALSATRCNRDMKAFFRRLTVAGKQSKLALIAVARKLVILANTLLAADRLWLPEPPKYA
jgi:transposase